MQQGATSDTQPPNPERVHAGAPAIQPSSGAARAGWRIQFRPADLLLLVGVLGVAASMSMPLLTAARDRANTRACYANQKTVIGAVEMYSDPSYHPPANLDYAWESLRRGGYLASTPDDPGQGAGTKGNYRLVSGNGNGISCIVHGTIQE